MTKLPFYCCSLSLTPFKNAVCSPDGIVFDLLAIIPYIKKYKKNPVTGKELKM
jgi:peptidyl-prolyl cis-trans isomerase-like protein 2